MVGNPGSTPTYTWNVNGIPASAVGTSYTYMPSNGDVVTATLNSSAACATPTSVSSSLDLTVLTTGTPSITIASDHSDTVCQGTVVNFTTTATAFAGTAATYSWLVNGVNEGSTNHYSYIPADGDMIYAVLTEQLPVPDSSLFTK